MGSKCQVMIKVKLYHFKYFKKILDMSKVSFINNVDKTGGGGLPNAHITAIALFSKMDHEGGKGAKNPKKQSTWYR